MATQPKVFDLIVIGSGPGGYLSALLAARKGLSVAIVERGDLGGTCLNRGCIPTKTLLKESSLWDSFSRAGWVKEKDQGASCYQKALGKKEAAVNQVVSGIRGLLKRDRVTLYQGDGSFVNSRTLSIRKEGTLLEALESDRILIASGAVPREISQLKRDGQRVMESDDILCMQDLPSTLAVVGGGRRGVEFATFFNTFGVKVTLIEKRSLILHRMDREISIRYKNLLAKKDIQVLTERETVASELREDHGPVALTVLNKGKEERLEFEKVLLVGERRGNTDGLGIERASLTLQNGFIPVDSRLRTASHGIYAVGDVTGRSFSAHKAFYEAKIALEDILGKSREADYRQIPICLYGYPEAASGGLTEEEARGKMREVKVGKFPFMACGRSVASNEQEGMVKIISDPKYGEVLGVHIMGPGATEMIHLGVMAMKLEMAVEEIEQMIFAHPTFSEAFLEAALDTHDEAIHMIKA